MNKPIKINWQNVLTGVIIGIISLLIVFSIWFWFEIWRPLQESFDMAKQLEEHGKKRLELSEENIISQ